MKMISRVMSNVFKEDAEDTNSTVSRAASELQTIVTRLQSTIRDRTEVRLADPIPVKTSDRDPAAVADRIAHARSKLTEILSKESVSTGPPLDILLDLFVSESIGRKVSVSDAALAGKCPATTGLRWVATLEEAGLIKRADDLDDHRRAFLSLTPRGYEVTVDCIETYNMI